MSLKDSIAVLLARMLVLIILLALATIYQVLHFNLALAAIQFHRFHILIKIIALFNSFILTFTFRSWASIAIKVKWVIKLAILFNDVWHLLVTIEIFTFIIRLLLVLLLGWLYITHSYIDLFYFLTKFERISLEILDIFLVIKNWAFLRLFDFWLEYYFFFRVSHIYLVLNCLLLLNLIKRIFLFFFFNLLFSKAIFRYKFFLNLLLRPRQPLRLQNLQSLNLLSLLYTLKRLQRKILPTFFIFANCVAISHSYLFVFRLNNINLILSLGQIFSLVNSESDRGFD